MIIIKWIIDLYIIGKITLGFNLLAIIIFFSILYSKRNRPDDVLISCLKDVTLSMLLFISCLFWYLGPAKEIFDKAGENYILLQVSNIGYLIFEPLVGVFNFLWALYVKRKYK